MLLSISFQAKPFPNLPFSFPPPGTELPWPEFSPFPTALPAHSQVSPGSQTELGSREETSMIPFERTGKSGGKPRDCSDGNHMGQDCSSSPTGGVGTKATGMDPRRDGWWVHPAPFFFWSLAQMKNLPVPQHTTSKSPIKPHPVLSSPPQLHSWIK